MKHNRVFISGFYSNGDKARWWTRLKWFIRHWRIARLARQLGLEPIAPILESALPDLIGLRKYGFGYPRAKDYYVMDLALLETCDYIYMLEGWDKSRGARTEYQKAIELHIPFIYLQKDKWGVI